MARADRIAQVESELAEQRSVVAEATARLRGLEAELEALRAGLGGEGSLVTATRTDAIVAVLHQAAGTMSPSDIVGALEAAGRSDDLRSVTATLNHLMKKEAVGRPSPGRYLAS